MVSEFLFTSFSKSIIKYNTLALHCAILLPCHKVYLISQALLPILLLLHLLALLASSSLFISYSCLSLRLSCCSRCHSSTGRSMDLFQTNYPSVLQTEQFSFPVFSYIWTQLSWHNISLARPSQAACKLVGSSHLTALIVTDAHRRMCVWV